MKIIRNDLISNIPCSTFKDNSEPSKLNEIWNKSLAGELYKFSKRALYLSTYSVVPNKDYKNDNNIIKHFLLGYYNSHTITIKIDKENVLDLYLIVSISEFNSVWFNYYYFNDGKIDMSSFIEIFSRYNINSYNENALPKDSIELCVSKEFNNKQFVVINDNISEENLENELNNLIIIDIDIYNIKYLNIYRKNNDKWWTFDTAKAYYKSAKRLCFVDTDKYINHIIRDFDINSIPKFVGKYKCVAIKRDSEYIEFYFDKLGDDVYVKVLFLNNNRNVVEIVSKNKYNEDNNPISISPCAIEPYEIFNRWMLE